MPSFVLLNQNTTISILFVVIYCDYAFCFFTVEFQKRYSIKLLLRYSLLQIIFIIPHTADIHFNQTKVSYEFQQKLQMSKNL